MRFLLLALFALISSEAATAFPVAFTSSSYSVLQQLSLRSKSKNRFVPTTTIQEGTNHHHHHHHVVQRSSVSSSTTTTTTSLSSLFREQQQQVLKHSATVALPFIRHEISIVARAVATVLAGFAAAKFKRHVLEQWIQSRSGAKRAAANGTTTISSSDDGHRPPPIHGLGRLSFYNTFLNILISKVVFMFLVSLFQIDLGPGLRSIFAVSSAGAIVFGIASKDLAQQVVGGFVIATWDVFEVGETVHLVKSDIQGTVRHVGLMDTEIERTDDAIIKIPNSEIFNQRVCNLSRVNRSQVKQTLRFQYNDLKKLPAILEEIKEEIRYTCPFVITNGSKPFRVHLYDYRPDHVEVIVNVHMSVPPSTTAYMDCRQQVLQAIGTAVDRCGIRFAIPAVNYFSGPPGVHFGPTFGENGFKDGTKDVRFPGP